MNTIDTLNTDTHFHLDMDALNQNLQTFMESEGSQHRGNDLAADMTLHQAASTQEQRVVTDAIRPTFKTDAVGSLILRFDVLKSALQGKDTPELRLDLSSHINAMMTSARALLVTDAGLIRKNLVRLEAAGISVALCPEESGDGHLLILFAQNVGFSRKVYLRKFITTT